MLVCPLGYFDLDITSFMRAYDENFSLEYIVQKSCFLFPSTTLIRYYVVSSFPHIHENVLENKEISMLMRHLLNKYIRKPAAK